MNYLLQILQTVLVVSLIIAFVWLFSDILGKKAGYRWRKILWLLLAVRLLFPLSFPLESMMDSFQGFEITVDIPEQFAEVPVESSVVVENTGLVESNVHFMEKTGNEPAKPALPGVETTPVKKGVSVAGCIACVWFLGAAIMFGRRILQYRTLKKKCFAQTISCEKQVVFDHRDRLCKELHIQKQIPIRTIPSNSDIGNSPMLFGYVHPMLLIPDVSYENHELEAIVRHELTHYRTKDLWYKLFILLICDIYWFNPIFPIMKKMAFHDVEFVCDENVTKEMDLDAKKKYSSIILKTMSGSKGANLIFATRFAGSKKSAKERFENIFASPNRKIGMLVLGLLVVVIVAGTVCISVSVLKEDEEIVTIEENKADAGTEMNGEMEAIEENETSSEPVEQGRVLTVDSAILGETGEALLPKLREEFPDYDIKVMDLSTSEPDQQEPDVYVVSNIEASELAATGRIEDISEAFNAWSGSANIEDAIKATVSDSEGRIYGIPKPYYAYGLYMNAQLFEAAGLVDEAGVPIFPATWEELAQSAVLIKEKTGVAGLCLLAEDYAASMQFCNIAWNFGATEFASLEPDGSYTANIDSEAAIAAMGYVKDLKWKYDVLTRDPLKENFITGYEQLANDEAAMYLGANDAISFPVSYGMEEEAIAIGAVPAGPGGEQYSIYGGSVIVFKKGTTQQEVDTIITLLEMMGYDPKLSIAFEDDTNVNPAFYQPYYDAVGTPGNLKAEESRATAALYEELLQVLRKVLTDPDADVEQLMKSANENWQKVLDRDEY